MSGQKIEHAEAGLPPLGVTKAQKSMPMCSFCMGAGKELHWVMSPSKRATSLTGQTSSVIAGPAHVGLPVLNEP